MRTAKEAINPTAEVKLIEADLSLPNETIKFATKLLDQQMWCWGQDVARAKFNALIAFGFERYAPKSSAGEKAISHYILRTQSLPTAGATSEYQVGLWGSGIFYGEPELGGVYIRRYGFAAVPVQYHSPIEQIDGPEELAPHVIVPAPERLKPIQGLVSRLCRWICDYELWSVNQLGLDHRISCLKDWKKAIVSAAETASEWRKLADLLQHRCA